jgi:hypothetical protein
MKATIEFDDELYRQLKAAAALRGRKVKDLVAEGIRMVLSAEIHPVHARRIQLPAVKSQHPGSLRLTNETISELELDVERKA